MDKDKTKIYNEMVMETTKEVMNIISETTDKMRAADLPPYMGFELLRAVGFAVTGSSLMYFRNDDDRTKAGDELVNNFRSYLSKSIEANKGMGHAKKSSLILQ